MIFDGYSMEDIKNPFLIEENGKIIHVSSDFLHITEYEQEEIVGKSLEELNYMLRITPIEDFSLSRSIKECFLFTKQLEYKHVKIHQKEELDNAAGIYEFEEVIGSGFNQKFSVISKLMEDNRIGIGVYSSKQLILLKANQAYLDILDEPYNNFNMSIGRKIDDFVDWEKVGRGREVWAKTVETGETYYGKEIKGITGKWKDNYCDNTIIPIIEEGRVKYIVSMIEDITDKVLARKRNEIQKRIIEEQNRKLEAILQNMSDGVFVTNREENFLLLNNQAKKFIYDLKSVRGLGDGFANTTFTDIEGNIISNDNLPLQRSLKGETVKGNVTVIKLPDKELIVECNSSPIYDEDYNLIMAVLCTHDITDLVNKEKLIEEQKNQLEVIFKNISDGVVLVDSKGRYIKANTAARELLGIAILSNLENDENVGHDLNAIREYIYRILNGEEIKNEIFIAKGSNNKYLNMNAKPVFDSEGRVKMGVICFSDITKDFLHKLSMEKQIELLIQIIDNLDFPLLRLSYPDSKIMDLNQKGFKMLKAYKPELTKAAAVKGRRIQDILPYIDDDQKNIDYVIKNKKIKYLRNIKYFMEGKERYGNLIYEPILDINGNIEEVLVIMVDVTSEIMANKDMEKILMLQEEFFTNISHELKTPLNVIYSTVQLINMYLNNNSLEEKKDSVKRYLSSITQNCYRLSKLINNIVDLSKIEAGYYELDVSNNNIVEIVEEIVLSVVDYSSIKGLNIIFDTNVEEKIIACDPEKIERIILNLISNAIKFSDEGNEIKIEIVDKGDFVDISVTDNGIGIDQVHLNMIFDRFKQVDKSLSRNAEGTGIGLSLVKLLVEMHGGIIFAESEIGKGSRFSVKLPARVVERESSISNTKIKTKGESVLIELSDIS